MTQESADSKLKPTGSGAQGELVPVAPVQPTLPAEVDPALDKDADLFVQAIMASPAGDEESAARVRATADALALETQRAAARQSDMLKQPIGALAKRSEDGGEVANALIALKMKVEELNPNGIEAQPGFGARLAGIVPGIGTPLKRYFTRFESAQTVIATIIRSLEQGRDQLKRDNVTMGEDQKRMRELSKRLEQGIKLGQLIDQKLEYTLARDLPESDPRHGFVRDELLFIVRQRVMDLQQQLAVSLQGVLAMEIIVRNNKELVRGVDRALTVTISALQVAVTAALALANQKIVLDKIQALNTTTTNLIAQTAVKLRTQGVEIQKQAASTSIGMEALKKAFTDLNGALDDISTFKRQALPEMAKAIAELAQLAQGTEQVVQRLEKAKAAEPLLVLEPKGEKDGNPVKSVAVPRKT